MGKACEGFIDAVIYYLLNEVIWSGRIGIHAGPFPNWIKSCQYFNSIGIVGIAHVKKSTIGRKLFILELKGMVQRIPGGWYIPKNLG
jgi:hypothetical protein